MRLAALVLVLAASLASADPYRGPANPPLPADAAPIRTSIKECVADVVDVIDLRDAELAAAGKHLCELREQHAAARRAVREGLAVLVHRYRGATNHDHDDNLARTIRDVQRQVELCLDALASQQWPHNIELELVPEQNAIFCDQQADLLLTAILRSPP
ncbi:MAG TPA: hypothetical protein VLX92_27430 [Kofleriaceae bacterium]|nr:hypothetical protein [Kofleriaceae bacterium]